MRELAVKSANNSNTTEDCDELQKEVDQLASEITRISKDTEFNTKKLIDGSASGAGKFTFQIGANTDQNIALDINDMSAVALKVATAGAAPGDPDVSIKINDNDQASANTAIDKINDAIQTVSQEFSKLGSYQNRLEHTINNLNTSSENLTAAESRVRDADMAKELMQQTKAGFLAQAS